MREVETIETLDDLENLVTRLKDCGCQPETPILVPTGAVNEFMRLEYRGNHDTSTISRILDAPPGDDPVGDAEEFLLFG